MDCLIAAVSVSVSGSGCSSVCSSVSGAIASMVVVAVGLGASTLMVSLALCCDGGCEACLGLTCGLGLVLGVLDLGIASGLCAVEGVVGTLEGGCGLSSNFGGCLGLGLAVSPLGGCAGKDVLGLGCTVGGIMLLVVASNGHLEPSE